MVGVEHETLGDLLFEGLFHRQRGLAWRKASTVADAKKVGVHRNGWLLEPDIQDHIGGLAADARERFEGFAIVGDFAAVLVDENLAEGKDVLGFAAEEADRLDEFGDLFHAQRHHGFGRGGEFEETLGGLVDAGIGRLGREDDGYKQSIGVDIVEFALGLWLDLMEPLENRLGLGAVQLLHFFRTWHSLDPESLPIFQGESIMPMQTSTTTSPLFSATLRPDRSLRLAGGWIGLGVAGLLGLPFLVAVPEFLLPGILGFSIATGGLAAISMRQARRSKLVEQITVWPDQIEVVTSAKGQEKQMRRLDPKKVRLLLDRDENERTTAMYLNHGDERIEIGAFLAVNDKSSFARAFGQAVRKARQG